MQVPDDGKDIDFGGSATYRIVVQGALSADWSDRLAGLVITTATRSGRTPQTTLVGPIRDQHELSAVFETLYGLHLTILEVEKLEDET